jgi:hypothetical protein
VRRAFLTLVGLLTIGVSLIPTVSSPAEAHEDFCMSDPVVKVVTPGGSNVAIHVVAGVPTSVTQAPGQILRVTTAGAPEIVGASDGGTVVSVLVSVAGPIAGHSGYKVKGYLTAPQYKLSGAEVFSADGAPFRVSINLPVA